jgi:hypothetical protein
MSERDERKMVSIDNVESMLSILSMNVDKDMKQMKQTGSNLNINIRNIFLFADKKDIRRE